MEKLTFELRVAEGNEHYFHSFRHKILNLVAGSYRGDSVGYYDPGGGAVLGYELQLAAWKTVSLAIQGTRSLRMIMPKDPEIEQYYLKHTLLADAMKNVTLLAFSSTNIRGWDSPPDQSIGIFDVTVVPDIFSVAGVTSVGLMYSGATKQWF